MPKHCTLTLGAASFSLRPQARISASTAEEIGYRANETVLLVFSSTEDLNALDVDTHHDDDDDDVDDDDDADKIGQLLSRCTAVWRPWIIPPSDRVDEKTNTNTKTRRSSHKTNSEDWSHLPQHLRKSLNKPRLEATDQLLCQHGLQAGQTVYAVVVPVNCIQKIAWVRLVLCRDNENEEENKELEDVMPPTWILRHQLVASPVKNGQSVDLILNDGSTVKFRIQLSQSDGDGVFGIVTKRTKVAVEFGSACETSLEKDMVEVRLDGLFGYHGWRLQRLLDVALVQQSNSVSIIAPVKIIHVHGPSGIGKSTLVQQHLRQNGYHPTILCSPLSHYSIVDYLHTQFVKYCNSIPSGKRKVLIIDDTHLVSPSLSLDTLHKIVDFLSFVKRHTGMVVILITQNKNDIHDLIKKYVDEEISLPTLTFKSRTYLVEQLCNHWRYRNFLINSDLDAKTLALIVNLPTIAGVVAVFDHVAHESNNGGDPGIVSMDDFKRAVKDIQRSFSSYQSNTDEDSSLSISLANTSSQSEIIGGLQQERQQLQQLLNSFYNPSTNAQFKSLGITPSKGILLYGPPGTGKTLLARHISTALIQVNFINVNLANVLSTHVGDSEKYLRNVFTCARMYAPCVVFFDEVDSMFRKADEEETSVTESLVRVMCDLLDSIDVGPVSDREDKTHESPRDSNAGILVIAATNHPDLIDPRLLRSGRLDTHIYIPPPSKSDRQDILTQVLSTIPHSLDVDENIELLATSTDGYTGADLKELVRRAAVRRVSESISRAMSLKINSDAIGEQSDNVCWQDVLGAMTEMKGSYNADESSDLAMF